MVQEGTVNGTVFITFLKRMMAGVPTPIATEFQASRLVVRKKHVTYAHDETLFMDRFVCP